MNHCCQWFSNGFFSSHISTIGFFVWQTIGTDGFWSCRPLVSMVFGLGNYWYQWFLVLQTIGTNGFINVFWSGANVFFGFWSLTTTGHGGFSMVSNDSKPLVQRWNGNDPSLWSINLVCGGAADGWQAIKWHSPKVNIHKFPSEVA